MVEGMSTYTVRYERDERGWWVAEVVGVAGCHTQGRSIAQARDRIREALGLFVEDAEKAALIDDISLPERMQHVVAVFIQEKTKAAAQIAACQAAGRELVSILGGEAKLSMRDVGELVGLSHQRIQQLVRKANEERLDPRLQRVAAG
jgi:predicted RNase H-like HicB family nuclease